MSPRSIRSRLSILLLVATAAVAAADVPTPTIEGPVTGGLGAPFIASTRFDLAQVGYMQEEFFMSGTANAYTAAGALGSDGKWAVTPGESAAYKTRLLVYRPTSRRKFR